MTRELTTFPKRFTELFLRAQLVRVSITLDTHEDAIRLRWRLQRFRQCHPPTHEARLLTLSVRRNILTIHRRDDIPSSRIQENPR